jgi:hypothetical protein
MEAVVSAFAKLHRVTDFVCAAIQSLWTERLKLTPCPRAFFQIEALECRQLLSGSLPLSSAHWSTVNPIFLALVQQSEATDPRFAMLLNAGLAKEGIAPPPLATASIMLNASFTKLHGHLVHPHVLHPTKPLLTKPRFGKPRMHKPGAHKPSTRKPAAHKPASHTGIHVLHGTGGLSFVATHFTSTLPVVTGTVLNYDSGVLPQQLIITFNEPVFANSWSAAVPVQDVSNWSNSRIN